MDNEAPGGQTHAQRVRRGRKKSNLKFPRGSKYDWPANLGELFEWYSDEMTDLSRAAQLRIQEATRIYCLVKDCQSANR